jgi:hypothetical protein
LRSKRSFSSTKKPLEVAEAVEPMGGVVTDPHLPDEAETNLGPSSKRSRKSAEAKPSQHISTTPGSKSIHSSSNHSSLSHSSSLLLDMDRHQGNPINSREQRSASHGTVDKDGWISIDTTQKSRDNNDNKEENEGGVFVVAPTVECHIHFLVDLEQSRAGGAKQKEHQQASPSNIRDKR